MSPRRRFGKKTFKALLPVVIVILAALMIAAAAIVYGVVRPPRRAYLVTPRAFSEISGPVLKVSDETWTNSDGTQARGWLLRGNEGAPAVVLLHRYGADRSWLFNLGVKLNETTRFTVLWPDLRGHGLNPPVNYTTFGTRETEDILAALDFLRTLKGDSGQRLIANKIGLYGVELGAYGALRAASQDAEIQALALDSLPSGSDELLRATVREDFGLDNGLIQFVTRSAVKVYLFGNYRSVSSCEVAAGLKNPRVMILSGEEAGYLRQSSIDVARCFTNPANVEVTTDLPLTGFRLASAPGEQGEAYDRRVITFLDRSLR